MIRKFILAFICSLSIGLFSLNAQKRAAFPHDIDLRDINNKKYSSKLFYNFGKPIIIEYWATHCAPCIKQLNSFKAFYKEWQEEYGVKIIVISIDSNYRRKRALKMIEDNNWPFQFYFDPDKELFKKIVAFGGTPETLIYDASFVLAARFIGIKPNYSYHKLNEDGSKGQKVRVVYSKKYGALDCDLSRYEKVLKSLKANNNYFSPISNNK